MLEIMTSVLALSSMLWGTSVQAGTIVPADSGIRTAGAAVDQNIVDGQALRASVASNPTGSVEADVRSYFSDTPILADIAGCESHFRQVDEKGNIVRGEINKGDIGVMQINEYYHTDTAKKLGLDINTLAGNMAYAKWLYEREGTSPWLSSSKCWDKYQNIARSN